MNHIRLEPSLAKLSMLWHQWLKLVFWYCGIGEHYITLAQARSLRTIVCGNAIS